MKIQLNTTRFCIGTGAKKKYEELLKCYFKFKGSKNDRLDLEQKIEGLKYFLKNVNIPKLRSKFPELDKGGNTELILEFVPDLSNFTICYNNTTINPPLLNLP